MRLQATYPPAAAAVDRYRRDGHWRPAKPQLAHLTDIARGGPRVALIDNDSQWTYQQLCAAIWQVRRALATAYVAADDTVLIVAPLRNVAAAAYLGTVLHGAVAVLIDRRCGESDIVNACRGASPRVALAFDHDAHRLNLADHCEVVPLDRIDTGEHMSPTYAGPDLDPDVAAVVLFTSGTSSAPKGVVHTINSLRCGTANMIEALNIHRDDAFYLSSPLASITGVLQLEAALTTHATVILEERFSPERALDRVNAHRATVIGGAPFVAQSVFDEAERQGRSVPMLRCIAVGGSMVRQPVLDAAESFGVKAVRVYGSSEVPFSTATDPHGIEAASDDGGPMHGVETGLHGDGELIIRGPHQFHGYLDPVHNQDAFVDGWVRTGDLADVEHDRVRIKGRLKEVAIRKGMKVSLAEIDGAAASFGECAAFAIPDEVTGERVVLAIDGTAARDISFDQVIAHLTSTGLAKWKLPEQIALWGGPLPRTSSGKISRAELAQAWRRQRSL